MALLAGGIYTKGVSVGLAESTLGGNSAKAHRAFTRAVGYWQSSLGGDCPIRFAPAGDIADARISLVDSIPGSGEELGLIEMKKTYGWMEAGHTCSTTAKISVMKVFEGQALSEDEMTEVMAHEMGHLLGLADVEESDPIVTFNPRWQ